MTSQTTSPSPAWLSSLTDLWQTAERLALLTIVAFGLSVLVNSLVFDAWGHTFLALATPTDVLMSGLRLGLIPLMMSSAYFVAHALVITRQSRGGACWAFWCTLIFWCLVASRLVGYGPPAARLWWVVIVPAWLVGGLVGLGDLRARNGVDPSDLLLRFAAMIRARLRELTRVTLGLILLAFSTSMVWTNVQVGYFAWPLRLADEDTPPSCEGRVLWSGERALLIDCGQAFVQDVQILYGEESVRLIKDARARPNPRPPQIFLDARAWFDAWRTSAMAQTSQSQ